MTQKKRTTQQKKHSDFTSGKRVGQAKKHKDTVIKTHSSGQKFSEKVFDFSAIPQIDRKVHLATVEDIAQFEENVRQSGFLYESTLINDNFFKSFHFFVGPAPLLGKDALGVYCAKDIPASVCIGEYTGEIYSNEEYEKKLQEQGKMSAYLFQLRDRKERLSRVIDAEFKGEWPRYMNDSKKPNVYAIQEKDAMRFYSLCLIPAGTQLAYPYGADYFSALDFKPLFNNGSRYADEGFSVVGTVPFLYEKNIMILEETDALLVSSPGEMTQGFHFLAPLIWRHVDTDDVSGMEQALSAHADKMELALNLPGWQLDAQGRPLPDPQQPCLTTLMLACYRGSKNSIDWLLAHGADPDCFHHQTGHTALTFLLAGTADPEIKTQAGSALLKKMHFPFASGADNLDILDHVIREKQPEIFRVLIQNLSVYQKYNPSLDPFGNVFEREESENLETSLLDQMLTWSKDDFTVACAVIQAIFSSSESCMLRSCLWKNIAQNKCFSETALLSMPVENLLAFAQTLDRPECSRGLSSIEKHGPDFLQKLKLTISLRTNRRCFRSRAVFFADVTRDNIPPTEHAPQPPRVKRKRKGGLGYAVKTAISPDILRILEGEESEPSSQPASKRRRT